MKNLHLLSFIYTTTIITTLNKVPVCTGYGEIHIYKTKFFFFSLGAAIGFCLVISYNLYLFTLFLLIMLIIILFSLVRISPHPLLIDDIVSLTWSKSISFFSSCFVLSEAGIRLLIDCKIGIQQASIFQIRIAIINGSFWQEKYTRFADRSPCWRMYCKATIDKKRSVLDSFN